jgi:phospholipid transport system substrate-binding protein
MGTIYPRLSFIGRITVRFKTPCFRFLLVLLIATTSFAAAARAEQPQPLMPATVMVSPSAFIQQLGDLALQSLTDTRMPLMAREERVRAILANYFDIQTIGRFAMGQHWRDASDLQRQEYLTLFEDSLVRTYARRFEDYAGQRLEVGAFTPSGETDYIVASQVVQQGGPAVSLEWRVRKTPAGLKIVDVVVEGISMSVTQRADFTAVIQRGGRGGVDALLASMREQSRARKT